jgi:hypothetical protein
LPIFAKQIALDGVILSLMQLTLTEREEPRTREAELPDDSKKARKNPVEQPSRLQDCTLEALGTRCKTETTVMRRILRFPLSL